MAPSASELAISYIEERMGVLDKQPAKCLKHGAFIAVTNKQTSKPSGCPVCADEVRQVRDREEQLVARVNLTNECLTKRLGGAMIPPRFAGKSFADYRVSNDGQRNALTGCRSYAARFREHYAAGRCLLLVGNVGTGKTHLAAALASELMLQPGWVVAYRTLPSMMQFIKGSFGSSASYTEVHAYERLIAPHLLIIDEIGATKPTDFELSAMFNVINGRYEQNKPTAVISNLMPEELGRAMGDRCADRLREGGAVCLVFDWASERPKVNRNE